MFQKYYCRTPKLANGTLLEVLFPTNTTALSFDAPRSFVVNLSEMDGFESPKPTVHLP